MVPRAICTEKSSSATRLPRMTRRCLDVDRRFAPRCGVIHRSMKSSCDEYSSPLVGVSRVAGRIARVSAEQLAVDPLTAARRLLGATLNGRGVSATIVEVEAYGGVRRRSMAGRRVALVSRSRRAQLGDVRPRRAALHLPQPRHPRVRERRVRARRKSRPRCCCGLRRSRRASMSPRPGAATSIRAAGTGAWSRAICARPWESPWTTTELTCSTPDSPVRLERSAVPLDAGAGPRVGVSKAADRPWRFWLAGRPEVSAYRRSPRAPAPGRQRLIDATVRSPAADAPRGCEKIDDYGR